LKKPEFVMAGLVPAIHVLFDAATKKTWMPAHLREDALRAFARA
jgi:hypothetical protein